MFRNMVQNAQRVEKEAFREPGKLILLIDAKELEIMLKMKLEGEVWIYN